jgi:drug/metabolite transporter (DMT)-like permease
VTLRQALLTGALAAVWGSSYLLIKYALEGFEPEVVVFLRAALAAVALAIVVRARGGQAWAAVGDLRRRPRLALLLGTLAIALPFTLISVGELHVPSGLTAVLIAPVPLLVAAFAPFLDREELISPRQGAGLAVGLAGVALLVGVETVGSVAQFVAALGILGAAACYALAGFVVKRAYRGMSPLATSLISVATAAAITVLPAALTWGDRTPGARAILAVVALGVIHTGLAFVLLYQLIGELGPGRGALVTYLAPGVALIYGAALLDEPVTLASLGGLALVLLGVALASRAQPAKPRGARRSSWRSTMRSARP